MLFGFACSFAFRCTLLEGVSRVRALSASGLTGRPNVWGKKESNFRGKKKGRKTFSTGAATSEKLSQESHAESVASGSEESDKLK